MFQTARLDLREHKPSDMESLAALWNDEEIQRLCMGEYIVLRTEEAWKDMLKGVMQAPALFAIVEERETGAFVGFVALHHFEGKNRDGKIGIVFGRAWWGKGYGTEVMKWVVAYGFKELGLHRVSLQVYAFNERAVAVYRRM
ncbi:hypothetical protein EW146_g7627 [Bondarzewia mesenterica]|uniref:N-acetyltransferase domain-containing protein n=1 Tax=Bondarzewia mesenterica TaxID=1095465 RepID=A0A4S4LK94_9AGAM|nr:hypothetical protein EW146_g7627 [Bondarzewia mesenterica]